MPTWKRLKIVQGLIWYRNNVRKSERPKLEHIRTKLREMAAEEREREVETSTAEATIEGVVGKINPRESDVIQALRRSLRVIGRKFNTEKAYVGNVNAFMEDLGLKTLADFEDIGGAEVEAHLTDLAVDGDVAPSTQNRAYFALLYLFENVFKRDFGKINALRSAKGPRIPTVMSKSEVIRVLSFLTGIYLIVGQLLYGCGMRISECLRLRIKDIQASSSLAFRYVSCAPKAGCSASAIEKACDIVHVSAFTCNALAIVGGATDERRVLGWKTVLGWTHRWFWWG